MSAFVSLTILTALRVLARNRLRAGLTMFGIIIGVAAAIAVVSIGEGAKWVVPAQIAMMGTNFMITLRRLSSASGGPGEEPVGAVIRIKNVPFRVIGVLAPKGQSAQGSDQDDVIFIPFSTAERKVFGTSFIGSVGAMFGSTDQVEDLPVAAEQIREVLRARHRLQKEQDDDFTIRTQVDIGKIQEGTSETLTIMLFAIASVSLLVGGIGIMNILLVSVTERTREIGVRMAVGAKRHHIVMQFLIEAMTLSLVGGALGIALGITGAKLTTLVAGWPAIISGNVIMLAFSFSLVVGLFFGLYPANKAARLNPIEALRYE